MWVAVCTIKNRRFCYPNKALNKDLRRQRLSRIKNRTKDTLVLVSI